MDVFAPLYNISIYLLKRKKNTVPNKMIKIKSGMPTFFMKSLFIKKEDNMSKRD